MRAQLGGACKLSRIIFDSGYSLSFSSLDSGYSPSFFFCEARFFSANPSTKKKKQGIWTIARGFERDSIPRNKQGVQSVLNWDPEPWLCSRNHNATRDRCVEARLFVLHPWLLNTSKGTPTYPNFRLVSNSKPEGPSRKVPSFQNPGPSFWTPSSRPVATPFLPVPPDSLGARPFRFPVRPRPPGVRARPRGAVCCSLSA